MKRSGTALAAALAAIFAAAACNDYGNTFQGNTGAAISFLSPSNVNAGGPDLTLTVNGSGFVAQTVVQWNGQTLATKDVTDSAGNILAVTAVVPAAMTTKSGLASVQTLNPHSGAGTNGLSNAVTFVINNPPNPVPTVSSMAPTCAVAGSAAFTLTITGTNFIPTADPTGGSVPRWSAGPTLTNLAVVSGTATQIQATVPATLLTAPGSTAMVTVFNPPSQQPTPPGGVPNPSAGGGGTSANGQTFSISATCPAGASANNPANAATATVEEETPAVSMDGRYVAYTAAQDGHAQVFVRDTCDGADASCQPRTTLLSAAADGNAANDDSRSPSMSADGRYVAFSSAATNLASNAPVGRQVYLRDTCVGADPACTPSTQLVSSDPNGALVGTESILPSISASGRFVAFLSVSPSHAASSPAAANKTTASALNSGYRQVFVRDTCLGATNCTPKTTRISLQPGDGAGTAAAHAGPAISGSANRMALAGGNTAVLFTRSIAVDDRVFLGILNDKK